MRLYDGSRKNCSLLPPTRVHNRCSVLCSEECYVCVDHCPRSLLEVARGEGAAAGRHALLLTLLENHEGRTVEMVSRGLWFYLRSRRAV